MKKLLLMKTVLLLFALVVGSTSVWADDTDVINNSATSSNLGSTGTSTWATNFSITGTSGAVYYIHSMGTQNTTNALQWNKYGFLYATKSGGKLKSITVIGTNGKNLSIYAATSAYSAAPTGTALTTMSLTGSAVTYNFDENSAYGFIAIKGKDSSTSITSISIVYENGPSISANDVNIASDATSGEIAYTISNPNGSTLTAAEKSPGYDWIDNVTVVSAQNKVTFTTTENTGAAREGYITLTYGTVTKDVKITQAVGVTKYTVTIETPTNGTLVVKRGDTPIATGAQIPDGTELTIELTPASGYRMRNWQAVDASTHTFTAANATTYTINAHDVTIKANFDVEYSVNWSVNGNVTSTGFIENETIVFPNRPADIVGKKFVGWTASEIVGTQADVPTLINYGTKMGTSNLTYYAVFADASGASSTATLTGSEISSNLASAQMSYGTEKTYTDTSDGVTWVGCGNTDAASRPWVQLRSKADAYFKISTLKNIEEVKLTISNTNNQAGGITDISKHGAFAGTVCIESAAQSTPTGVYASSNVVSNNIVTVSLPVSLKEFYIQTTAGARVWGIELTTNNYTYSNYRTTVPTTATITLNAACTDGSLVYGTYSNSQAFVVPADLVVSEIKVDNGKLQLSDYSTDDVVPANTGVLVAALAGGNYDVTLSAEAGTSVLGNGNMLKASGDAGITADGMSAAASGCIYYRLTMHNGTQLGFWWGAENGASFALAANKAYLAVPTSSARDGLWIDDDATALTLVNNEKRTVNNEYFDLQGRKVTNPTKGLYIVNGKKVIIK